MKKIKEFIDLLRDLRFRISTLSLALSDAKILDNPVSTNVALTSEELSRILSEVSKTTLPPLHLGEYYVVKVFKRNF